MKTCLRCSSENEVYFNFCDRCGESLSEKEAAALWPRYEALERVSNGIRFISRLAGLAGLLGAVGVFSYFWSRSLLVAAFFAGAAGLAGYVLLVVFRSVSELIRLFLDLEDHLRVMSGRSPNKAK